MNRFLGCHENIQSMTPVREDLMIDLYLSLAGVRRNGGRKTRKEGDIIQFKSMLALKTIKKGTDGKIL